MKLFWRLAFLLLDRTDYAGRRLIMRETRAYSVREPIARMKYRPPLMINKNKKRLFLLSFVMAAIDNPRLFGLFFLINFIFLCLMLARLFVYFYK